jgi:hypothetical protein
VEQAPGGEDAKPRGGQPELLADLDRAQRDPARVHLGVLVLLAEAEGEGTDPGAEERLLGRDELARPRTARERARLRAAVEVRRRRDPDEEDPEELEGVAEPPAQLRVLEEERRDERRAQEREPDDDEEVGPAAREEEGVDGAHAEEADEREADGEGGEGERAARLGHGRDEARPQHPDRPHERHRGEEDRLQGEQRPDALRALGRGKRRECEHGGADRERGAAGEGDEAVRAHEHARGGEPVQGEESGHDGERRADEDRAGVVATGADDREGQSGRHRAERAGADAPEMERAPEVGLATADRRQGRDRQRHAGCADGGRGASPRSQSRSHAALYRRRGRAC